MKARDITRKDAELLEDINKELQQDEFHYKISITKDIIIRV